METVIPYVIGILIGLVLGGIGGAIVTAGVYSPMLQALLTMVINARPDLKPAPTGGGTIVNTYNPPVGGN